MWTIEQWKKVIEYDLKMEMQYLEEDISRMNKKEYYIDPITSDGGIDRRFNQLNERVLRINKFTAELSTMYQLTRPASE